MRIFAFIMGIVLLIFGITGFMIHSYVWLNIFYLVSAGSALVVGLTNRALIRVYFQIFGVLFALLAILGFVLGDRFLNGSHPDTWLHVVIAVVCLILGYGAKD